MENTSSAVPGSGQNATTTAVNSYELDPLIETFKILITCILGVVMFGMGCAVDLVNLKSVFKKPKGLVLGLLCQIFMMPLLTYGLIKVASMTGIHAIVFMAVGCSPGGLFSNVITMMVDGDMALSIALTTCTNILAFATVPLWLLFFVSVEQISSDLLIPYSSLAISLVSLVVPIILGILFRIKFLKIAKYLAKGCAIFGFVLLIVTIVAMVVRNEVPLVFTANSIVPVVLLPLIGMTLSYLLSCIPALKLQSSGKRTVAIETSIQNGNLSNNIVFLTYANNLTLFTSAIPITLMYSVAQAVYNVILVFSYKMYRIWQRRNDEKDTITLESAVSYQNMDAFKPNEHPLV